MRTPFLLKRQTGSVILAMLAMFVLVAGYMLVKALNEGMAARDKITDDALVKAKEALLGFAATYRDSHAGFRGFGYLPCPAMDGNGVAGNCGGGNITVIGLFPWSTLGLPPLRDSSGECLWYAVSGTYKDSPVTATAMNWDNSGQLIVNDAAGTVMANGVAAVIFSPRSTIGAQTRGAAAATECGGNTTVANYLDGNDPIYAGVPPALGATTTLTLATAASFQGGTNNDRGIWITPREIFDRVKQRSDFKTDIDNLMNNLVNCLNPLSPGALPAASVANKGIDNVIGYASTPPIPPACVVSLLNTNVRNNWRDNLLYARTGGSITVNGSSCNAVLVFGGERAGAQVRTNVTQKALAANYLEGTNLASFPGGATYNGATAYDKAAPNADIVRCITGAVSPGTQVTFASNFGDFTAAGTGVSTNAGTQSVTVSPSAGANGGCFWYPTAIPLSGKTLRAYYNYTFTDADTRALTGSGPDHGNGFSLSFLRGDVGAPASCGVENDMGVLSASTSLGNISLFVETDVHRDNGDNDPVQNHTAIMLNGSVNHPAGTVTTACNGTLRGCAHTPANKFEESPTPQPHNQRVEIHTGYTDAACSASGSGSYALVKAWVDCAACSDTSVDFAPTPTILRCIALDPAMDSIYFGFTGGFSTGGGTQGVVIQGLDLRTQ